MQKSERTKKLNTTFWIVKAIQILVIVFPVIYFVIDGLANDHVLTSSKVSLMCSVTASILLVIINLVLKHSSRSVMFIILLGMYYAVEHFLIMLFIVTATVLLDDYVLTPLLKSLNAKRTASKEIDRSHG